LTQYQRPLANPLRPQADQEVCPIPYDEYAIDLKFFKLCLIELKSQTSEYDVVSLSGITVIVDMILRAR
jgi:hypothetical protein